MDAVNRAVNRATGTRWTVLGRLAGGSGDAVYRLGHGQTSAVLKVKRGAWWAGQLARAVDVVDRLRAVGYPTPPVLATGSLDEERHFLVTGYQPGHPVTTLDPSTVDDVLAAVELQSHVRPAPVRDWSVMVTAFLDGDPPDVHPTVRPLARRALALVPRPVPPLPTGDFTHGDFTVRNMLRYGHRLAAIVDVEGFGRGTRVIDLVALLQSVSHPRSGDPDLARRVTGHAIGVAGADPFAACVAHRVLAALASATEHPDQLADARLRAEGLLDQVRG